MKTDCSGKNQLQRSILKTDPTSPAPGESKRVHFMESDELNTNSTTVATSDADVEENEVNNQQTVQTTVALASGDAGSSTPDKDSSTITIFNENSEVPIIYY